MAAEIGGTSPVRHSLREAALLALLLITELAALAALAGPIRSTMSELPVARLSSAQQGVTFRIPRPAWLPGELALQSADAVSPRWARTFYGPTNRHPGRLLLETALGDHVNEFVFPQHAKQTVQVQGWPATCVTGGWDPRQEWSATVDGGDLVWSADGLTYHLRASGLGLGCRDLIRIAESLR